MIDPRDVGAAAARVLSGAGHERQTCLVTGPAAITYAEVAAELSAATGSTITFIDVPDDAAQQALTGHGVPEFAAEQIVRAFAMLRQGAGSAVTPTVRELTGAAPRDFAAFARDHARHFAPVPIAATGGKR